MRQAAAFGTEAAPLAGKQGAAEQVGPDLEPVEAEFVALSADADQRGRFCEERQLDRRRPGRGLVRAFGHDITESVSLWAELYQRKRQNGAPGGSNR